MKLSINVTSDFLCPWCRIADARLSRVLASLPEDIEAEINWLPFELNPDMPATGMDRKVYRSAKFGNWEYSQKLDAQTEQAALGDGVTFNYSAIKRVPNTLSAHRLVWLTPEGNQRVSIVESLFRAYFQEGRDIGELEVLADIASENGLHREKTLHLLRSTAGEAEVIQLEDVARQRRISSVPSFEIAGIELTGAVSAEVLFRTIVEAYNNRLHPEVDHVR